MGVWGALHIKCRFAGFAIVGAVYDRPYFVDSRKRALIERPYRYETDFLCKAPAQERKSHSESNVESSMSNEIVKRPTDAIE